MTFQSRLKQSFSQRINLMRYGHPNSNSNSQVLGAYILDSEVARLFYYSG